MVKILIHSFIVLLLILAVRYLIFPTENVFVSVIAFIILFYALLIPSGRFVKIDYMVVFANIPLLARWKKKC